LLTLSTLPPFFSGNPKAAANPKEAMVTTIMTLSMKNPSESVLLMKSRKKSFSSRS
jgi:hypothetical protein